MPFDAFIAETKTTADLLRAAKAHIDTPAKWCQGSFQALRADGMHHCTLSALNHALGCPPGPDIARHLMATRRVLARHLLMAWGGLRPTYLSEFPQVSDGIICSMNNQLTHDGLMQVFDRAIAQAEGSAR
jgi:hypothetical protein